MRDAFLKNLAEEGGYDSYPFGNPEKRVHGLYVKHNGDKLQMGFVLTLVASSVLFE